MTTTVNTSAISILNEWITSPKSTSSNDKDGKIAKLPANVVKEVKKTLKATDIICLGVCEALVSTDNSTILINNGTTWTIVVNGKDIAEFRDEAMNAFFSTITEGKNTNTERGNERTTYFQQKYNKSKANKELMSYVLMAEIIKAEDTLAIGTELDEEGEEVTIYAHDTEEVKITEETITKIVSLKSSVIAYGERSADKYIPILADGTYIEYIEDAQITQDNVHVAVLQRAFGKTDKRRLTTAWATTEANNPKGIDLLYEDDENSFKVYIVNDAKIEKYIK